MQTGNEEIVRLLGRPVTSDYDQLVCDLEELTIAVQREVMRRLLGALKAKIKEVDCQTYGDKQALTKWLNGELRKFGLTLSWTTKVNVKGQLENRAYQAHIVADVGNNPEEGRFQVRYRNEAGKMMKPLSTPHLSVFLEQFEIMVDDPRRHQSGKWADRIERREDRYHG